MDRGRYTNATNFWINRCSPNNMETPYVKSCKDLFTYVYIYTYIHLGLFDPIGRWITLETMESCVTCMCIYIYTDTWMQWAMPSFSGCDMAPLNNTCGRNLFVCLSIGPNSQGFTRTYNFEFPLNHLNLMGFRNNFAHTHKQSAKMWPILAYHI